MVPSFAPSVLPLMAHHSVASDDLPATDDSFAAVLAGMGEAMLPAGPWGVPLGPSDVGPPMTARGDPPEIEAGPWIKTAWPDKLADVPLDMLTPDMPTQTVAAVVLAPPPVPSDAGAAPPKANLPPERATPQAWATAPFGPALSGPATPDLPKAGTQTAAWAAYEPEVGLGERDSAPASTPGPPVVAGTDTLRGVASLPNGASGRADGPAPAAPLVQASLPNLIAGSGPIPSPQGAVSEVPAAPHRPETALQSDLGAMLPQTALQTAPQIHPSRADLAFSNTAVDVPPPLTPSDHPARTKTGQPGPAESPQWQGQAPIPSAGLARAGQPLAPPAPDAALGQARHQTRGGRDAPADPAAQAAETTIAPQHAATVAPRPPATSTAALDRPALHDSRAETRALLRQLAPTSPDQEGPVEISLFPKGLGQVRLDIQHGPMGARILVSADRPETLDLIRRHAADLVAEFRTAGMANPVISFAPVDASPTALPAQRLDAAGLLAGGGSFGGSSQHADGSPQGQPAARPDTPPGANPPPYRSDVVPGGGLILRL